MLVNRFFRRSFVLLVIHFLCNDIFPTFAQQEANQVNTLKPAEYTAWGVKKFPDTISLQDKIFTLSTIWSEIKFNFVNLDRINFDADSLYKTTITKIAATKNDIEYYDVLERFICFFEDGHTQLLNTSYFWNDYFDYIPCGIKEFNGEYYFTRIRKNAGIDSTLLGAKITELEGTPTIKYVEENYFPYIPASNRERKLYLAQSKIGQGLKHTFLCGIAEKLNGEKVTFSIQRNGESTRTEHDEYWEIKPRPDRSSIRLDWYEKTAILKINTFRETVIPEMDSLFNLISLLAEGLVIDLRDNGGGSTETALQLQKYLTRDDYFLSFGAQTRINNAYGRSQGNYREEYKNYFLNKAYKSYPPDSIFVEKSIQRITCPVVILIGKFSFSACEDFLVNIYELPERPLLIGEKTGGSSGAPLVLNNLPNETIVRICTIRILFPYSMKEFTGTGIKPDIEVAQNFKDFLSNKDNALDKALNILKE